MGAHGGPADWWTEGTDAGRTHIATRGIVQDGLVLNLDAGVSSSYPGSGTTWTDLSGNGNNGTLVNGVAYTSDNGGAMLFDGVDDGFTASMSCNKQFYSVDWWMYPLSTLNYNQIIAFNVVNWGGFVWHTGSQGQYWAGTDVATRMDNVDAGSVEVNKWQNWTWTFNNGFASMYKNGNLLRTKTMNLSSYSSFTSIELQNGITDGYRSTIKIYSNKVLSESEVRQNFLALRGRYGV
jgi:hypothetical protein